MYLILPPTFTGLVSKHLGHEPGFEYRKQDEWQRDRQGQPQNCMHPIVWTEGHFDIEHQPHNYEAGDHDDENCWTIAGIKLRKVQVASITLIGNRQKALIEPALPTARTAAFETQADR